MSKISTVLSCGMAEDRILGLALGDAGEQQDQALARHVRRCPECGPALSEYRALLEGASSRAARGRLQPVAYGSLPSPIGQLFLAAGRAGLCRISFQSGSETGFRRALIADGRLPIRLPALLEPVRRQLGEYFDRRRREFELHVDLGAIRPFQRRVLDAIGRIGFGEVLTYAEVARRIAAPHAARAVGGALHANPVPIVVPCHRVVAAGGKLGGYAGGLEIKQTLLRLEGALPALF